MVTMQMLLAGLALFASVVLLIRHRPLLFPAIAVVVSALEMLGAFGLVHISVARVPLALIFGALLVLAGVGVYFRSSEKSVIASATAVAIAGALQALQALHLH